MNRRRRKKEEASTSQTSKQPAHVAPRRSPHEENHASHPDESRISHPCQHSIISNKNKLKFVSVRQVATTCVEVKAAAGSRWEGSWLTSSEMLASPGQNDGTAVSVIAYALEALPNLGPAAEELDCGKKTIKFQTSTRAYLCVCAWRCQTANVPHGKRGSRAQRTRKHGSSR